MYFDFNTYTSILPFLTRQRRSLPDAIPEAFSGFGPDSTVVDLGCGNAEIAALIARRTGAAVLAADPEPAAIDAAQVVVVSRRVEDLIELQPVEWQCALEMKSAVARVLCLHLVYHIPEKAWAQLVELALDRLVPGGILIFMTTSSTAEIHNIFSPSDVVRNMVARSHNLEQIYGRYIFGEDLASCLSRSGFHVHTRTREFEIRWPFHRPSLRFLAEQRPSQIEGVWTKLFSFLYRLPQAQIAQEFSERLRFLLKRSEYDLSLQGKDVIHVAVKGS